jgi:hypothetical protein
MFVDRHEVTLAQRLAEMPGVRQTCSTWWLRGRTRRQQGSGHGARRRRQLARKRRQPDHVRPTGVDEPGALTAAAATPSSVFERMRTGTCGLSPQQLFAWRREARKRTARSADLLPVFVPAVRSQGFRSAWNIGDFPEGAWRTGPYPRPTPAISGSRSRARGATAGSNLSVQSC